MPELWNGVFLATCIASAIGTIVMAFLANKPFAMAPGMGLNSFFAVVVTNIVALTGMTYVASFQAALCIVLVEGIVFLILSVLNIREKIVDAIPLGVRLGLAPAIGLMLLNIGVGSNCCSGTERCQGCCFTGDADRQHHLLGRRGHFPGNQSLCFSGNCILRTGLRRYGVHYTV